MSKKLTAHRLARAFSAAVFRAVPPGADERRLRYLIDNEQQLTVALAGMISRIALDGEPLDEDQDLIEFLAINLSKAVDGSLAARLYNIVNEQIVGEKRERPRSWTIKGFKAWLDEESVVRPGRLNRDGLCEYPRMGPGCRRLLVAVFERAGHDIGQIKKMR